MTTEQLVELIATLENYIENVVYNKELSTEETYHSMLDARVKLINKLVVTFNIAPTPKTTITNLECPDCGGPMLARANRLTGEKFWGCKAYPDCRGTRDSEGKSKEDRRREKPEPVDERFRFKRE
jgi:hypothetical protein